MVCISIIAALLMTGTAAPPPETCDPELISQCLSKFEIQLSSCDDDDIHCQCQSIIKSGANCYAACPQEALTKFIKTYSSGKCADYDPYLSKRSTTANNLEIGNEIVKAITVTPTEPTTTISLSPQEYQSRLEKSRYKENLRSIRSERARISREAEQVHYPQGVNKHESQYIGSASSTDVTSTKYGQTSKSVKENKKNAGSHSGPLAAFPAMLLALV